MASSLKPQASTAIRARPSIVLNDDEVLNPQWAESREEIARPLLKALRMTMTMFDVVVGQKTGDVVLCSQETIEFEVRWLCLAPLVVPSTFA